MNQEVEFLYYHQQQSGHYLSYQKESLAIISCLISIKIGSGYTVSQYGCILMAATSKEVAAAQKQQRKTTLMTYHFSLQKKDSSN
jgi:hypothetical protein